MDVNQQLPDGKTLFAIALELDDPDIAEYLLQFYRLNVTFVLPDGRTALYIAVQKDFIAVARKIAYEHQRDGVDVNAATNAGVTPLMIAVERNHPDMVDMLCSHPLVRINQQTHNFASALLVATDRENVDIAEKLLSYEDRINPNVQARDGSTALHIAASKGNLELTRMLLAHPKTSSIELNLKTLLPIEIAKRKGHFQIVQLLEEHMRLSALGEWVGGSVDRSLADAQRLFQPNRASDTLQEVEDLIGEVSHSSFRR